MISEPFIQRENAKVWESATTVDNFNGEEKLRSRLKYSDVLHGSILLSPFFVPFMSYFSVVTYYLWCGTLFSRCSISAYQSIVMCRIVATCYISCVATQPHYISPVLSIAQYLNLTQYKCKCMAYSVYSDDSSANYSALLREGSGHIFQHPHLH